MKNFYYLSSAFSLRIPSDKLNQAEILNCFLNKTNTMKSSITNLKITSNFLPKNYFIKAKRFT